MISYEYKIQKFSITPTEAVLKGWGTDGWELCGIDSGNYIFKRVRQREYRRVKVIDTTTDEVFHYPSLLKACEALNANSAALRYVMTHHTLYYKRYKVEEDNGED